ncbi:hypothetical protein OH76DRAFT_538448 [Lentinus brumalis]|uniref:Uncharacterized protein n=1 Tax=Lentinus brumalis TaxID=2498619 RepID=A0A371CHM8_9APHY|nr:hypothetical protein OH76DRAFT_538448 [Polyporus brumalis]
MPGCWSINRTPRSNTVCITTRLECLRGHQLPARYGRRACKLPGRSFRSLTKSRWYPVRSKGMQAGSRHASHPFAHQVSARIRELPWCRHRAHLVSQPCVSMTSVFAAAVPVTTVTLRIVVQRRPRVLAHSDIRCGLATSRRTLPSSILGRQFASRGSSGFDECRGPTIVHVSTIEYCYEFWQSCSAGFGRRSINLDIFCGHAPQPSPHRLAA